MTAPQDEGRGMIRVHGLVQHYGVRPVLKGVSFEVGPGEIVVVMGPNGMGKSTLLSAVAGVLTPQRGFVEIGGHRRRDTPESELAARRLAFYLPDTLFIPTSSTAREWLLAVGRIYGIRDERLFAHLDQLLEVFQLTEKADSVVGSCSAGQYKKLSLAAALITETPVLILDEPFSGGLDPTGLYAMKHILQRFAETRERTVLMATPVPELVQEVATRVLLLHEGRIVALDTPGALCRDHGTASLAEVYEKLTNPGGAQKVTQYLDDIGRHG